MPRGKLKYALDKHQGRNLKLEKQRKQQKAAAKSSKPTSQKNGVPEPGEAEILAAMNGETEDEVRFSRFPIRTGIDSSL